MHWPIDGYWPKQLVLSPRELARIFFGPSWCKCNVCQAVNEQFHGNIVTLLLALDSSVVSWPGQQPPLQSSPVLVLVSVHSLGPCLPNWFIDVYMCLLTAWLPLPARRRLQQQLSEHLDFVRSDLQHCPQFALNARREHWQLFGPCLSSSSTWLPLHLVEIEGLNSKEFICKLKAFYKSFNGNFCRNVF